MAAASDNGGPEPRQPVAPPARSTEQAPTGPFRRVVRITNPLGLHMRAADRFHRAAKRFQATVVVRSGDAHADGKDLWALIVLAVPPGAELTLEVEGPDAAAALPHLADILADPNGEDYAI